MTSVRSLTLLPECHHLIARRLNYTIVRSLCHFDKIPTHLNLPTSRNQRQIHLEKLKELVRAHVVAVSDGAGDVFYVVGARPGGAASTQGDSSRRR